MKMTIYIDPFAAGILVTIIVELMGFIAYALCVSRRSKKREESKRKEEKTDD